MKRFFLLCLTILLSLTLAACRKGNDGGKSSTFEAKVLNDTYSLTIDGEKVTVVQTLVDTIDDEQGVTATLFETQTGTITEGEEYDTATLGKPTYRAVFEGAGADEVVAEWKQRITELYENGELSEEEYRTQYDLYDGKEVTDFNPYYLTSLTYSFGENEALLILSTVDSQGDEYRYTHHDNGAVKTSAYYNEGELYWIERYDVNGNYLGDVDPDAEYTYYDNGNVKTEILRYEDGSVEQEIGYREDGTTSYNTRYYEDGSVSDQTTYYENGQEKEYVSYFDDGTYATKVTYSEDGTAYKTISYEYDWDDPTLMISYQEVTYENGQIVADNTYDAAGNLLLSFTYELYADGTTKKETGKSPDGVIREETEYYESGMLKSEAVCFDNGKLESRTEYDENGNEIRMTEAWDENHETVTVVEYEYDENDNVTKITEYTNGTLTVYTLIEYYDDGTERKRTSYNQADILIAVTEYSAEGCTLSYLAYYDNGTLSEMAEYYENGACKKEETYDEDGSVLSSVLYDENGNATRDFSTDEDGNTTLTESTYDENGTQLSYALFINDLPVRKYEYYDDGSYKAEYTYHENGQLYQELHRHENGNYSIQGTYNEDGSLDYYCEINEDNRTTLTKFPNDGIIVRQIFTYHADGGYTIDYYNDETDTLLYSQDYDANGNFISQTNP